MSERDLNDARLLRVCRDAATEQPPPALDDRVLRAARTHAMRQRRRRQLLPFAAAAALALVFAGVSNMRRYETPAPVAQPAALDPITAELLRIQPRVATASAVEDFLLNPFIAQPVSGVAASDDALPLEDIDHVQ